MDDNPWGNPTPVSSEQATPAPVSPVVLPLDQVNDEVPAWSAQPDEEPTAASQEDEVAPEQVGQEDDGFEAMTVEGEEGEDTTVNGVEPVEVDTPAGGSTQTEAATDHTDGPVDPADPTPTTGGEDPEADVPTTSAADEPESVLSPDAAVADTPTTPDDPTPAPAPSPPANSTDDFGPDDGFGDDDDFGEMGGDGAGDDDFGDFGDFDDGPGAFEEAQFDSPPPPPAPAPAPVAAPAPPPVASTSGLPPLALDWSRPTRKALGPQLEAWFEEVYPGAADAMTDEPEREVDGVGQVLVTEPLRSMYTKLSTLPPLRPLDWRRSKARREHLIALGVPVNLDDSAELPALGSLVISPPSRSSTPANSSRAFSSAPPVSASPLPFATSSQVPSRSATPQGLDRYLPHSPDPPPLNKARAEALIGVAEQDLELMGLTELERMRDELDQLSVDASEVLTHALLMREKETGDGETYHGMIQDLVSAAAKMKTAGGKGPPARASSGSSRWSRALAK